MASRRAADRAMNSVIHQTAAPIGRVMSNAVPASVPTRRGGHTSNARGKFKNIKWNTLAQYSFFPTGLQNLFHPSVQVPTCSPFSSSPQQTPLHHPLLIPFLLPSEPSPCPSTASSASATPSPTWTAKSGVLSSAGLTAAPRPYGGPGVAVAVKSPVRARRLSGRDVVVLVRGLERSADSAESVRARCRREGSTTVELEVGIKPGVRSLLDVGANVSPPPPTSLFPSTSASASASASLSGICWIGNDAYGGGSSPFGLVGSRRKRREPSAVRTYICCEGDVNAPFSPFTPFTPFKPARGPLTWTGSEGDRWRRRGGLG